MAPGAAVKTMLAEERQAGVNGSAFYSGFQPRAETAKREFVAFLREQKRHRPQGRCVWGGREGQYASQLRRHRHAELLPYVADRSPAKQGKYLPGSRIPVVDENHLLSDKPDWVVIFPWNIHSEIETQLARIRDWGGKFVWAIPRLQVS